MKFIDKFVVEKVVSNINGFNFGRDMKRFHANPIRLPCVCYESEAFVLNDLKFFACCYSGSLYRCNWIF